jgi:hypothetical protein
MNTSSPFSFLESLVKQLQPPPWLVAEGQQRLVLLLNHVLMQEKEAQSRLARKKGSVIRAQWGSFVLDLLITPAGLTDRAPAGAQADLTLIIAEQAPWALAQSVLQGKTPAVKIEGDVMLAAELPHVHVVCVLSQAYAAVCVLLRARTRHVVSAAAGVNTCMRFAYMPMSRPCETSIARGWHAAAWLSRASWQQNQGQLCCA